MHPYINDGSDGCLATGEGTTEMIFTGSSASCSSMFRASDQRYGAHGPDSYLELRKFFSVVSSTVAKKSLGTSRSDDGRCLRRRAEVENNNNTVLKNALCIGLNAFS